MSLPTSNDIQAVDPVLTNVLVAYTQADARFIADKVFPAVSVDTMSGTFYVFDKKYWFTDQMQVRAPGQQFAMADFGVSTDTYKCQEVALEYPVADEIRAANQAPMDLETAGVRFLGQKNLIRREVAFAADNMLYSSWTSYDNNSATDWDDFTSGDPVNGVLTAKRTVSNLTGMDPNTMALGYEVHQALVNHPDILDRIKYNVSVTQANVEGALAALFGVERYLVGKAVYSNTNEASSFSASAIIDDDCLICYASPNPGIFEPSCGYTFNWAPGGGLGTIAKVRDDRAHADFVQLMAHWDHKIVGADLGYFFADIT